MRCLRFAPASFLFLSLAACYDAPESGSFEKTPSDATIIARVDPWTAQELLSPAELASQLNGEGSPPVIFDMGPAGVIKGAREIGPAQEEPNLARLRAELAVLSKNQPVVVYCGCCPFEPCPNIRPAFRTLKEQGFTNARLLNLTQNLKADWIDHGYPMED